MKKKTIAIDSIQEKFILCAIELKEAVIQLNKESLSAKEFKKDYGISKTEMRKAISRLSKQLK